MNISIPGCWFLLAASLSLVSCGSPDDGFSCRQACSRLEACGVQVNDQDCMHDCQVIHDVALDQSWVEWGACMLEDPCEALDLENCLDQVALAAPEREFEKVLDRVCVRVEDCELGITYKSCKHLIKEYGGKRIKQAKLLKQQVLTCVGDCVVETPCSRITDAVDPCLETCGVVFNTVVQNEND